MTPTSATDFAICLYFADSFNGLVRERRRRFLPRLVIPSKVRQRGLGSRLLSAGNDAIAVFNESAIS